MASKDAATVAVVGAGPVGLMAALRLAARGLDVRVLDAARMTKAFSYGLALHPDTLDLLDEFGIAGELIASGFLVRRVIFYDGASPCGQLDFSRLGRKFPFLVTIAQGRLEDLLEKQLKERGVKVRWNSRAARLDVDEDGATLQVDRLEEVGTGYPVTRFERVATGSRSLRSRFVIGADGYDSFVRTALHDECVPAGRRESYAVFEFDASAGANRPDEVRVVLHDGTVSVLWPLPHDRYRWAFEVSDEEDDPLSNRRFTELVAARAPWFTDELHEINWRARVAFEPRLAAHFGSGAAWLAGDAAHVTGPVGVQGMNIGLREARDLADIVADVVAGKSSPSALAAYDTTRRSEWTSLLDLGANLEATSAAPTWARSWKTRLPSLLPASGSDLNELLGQVGLRPGENRRGTPS